MINTLLNYWIFILIEIILNLSKIRSMKFVIFIIWLKNVRNTFNQINLKLLKFKIINQRTNLRR